MRVFVNASVTAEVQKGYADSTEKTSGWLRIIHDSIRANLRYLPAGQAGICDYPR
jgi:hypothetical protein